MTRFSVLDLCPIPEGGSAQDAFANSIRLAQAADELGFTRFWLAEHHNMPGIASAATSVVIGHVAGQTKRIRVGSGGVMLPNHAPLIIAEQFGTLATLYPDRIDLGLGRAPGTDQATARALRRGMDGVDHFPQDVIELMGYLSDAEAHVRAVPGFGTHVPTWILGSSLYGAQLAAQLGLPYAFASHFAPDALEEAFEIYRNRFQPSASLAAPYTMLAANVFAADDPEQSAVLKSSMQQSFARLRTGMPGPLPRPVEDITAHLPAPLLHMVNQAMRISVEGDTEMVASGLQTLIDRLAPDEIIFNGAIHDQSARLRAFEIAAEAMQRINTTSPHSERTGT